MRKICFYIALFVSVSTCAFAHVKARTHRATNIGIATWYGKEIHGRQKYKNKNGFHRKTANGEKFNTHQMTCATHINMPFNTILKVTDILTGNYIFVRVNDRMKAKPPRIIDLTLEAAEKLHIIRKGKTMVKVEPVEVAESH